MDNLVLRAKGIHFGGLREMDNGRQVNNPPAGLVLPMLAILSTLELIVMEKQIKKHIFYLINNFIQTS
jgi:hypothetical protein